MRPIGNFFWVIVAVLNVLFVLDLTPLYGQAAFALDYFFVVNERQVGGKVEVSNEVSTSIAAVIPQDSSLQGKAIEAWVGIETPFPPPYHWFFLDGENGWGTVISSPLHVTLNGERSIELLDIPLPLGTYTLYLLVDTTLDGQITYTGDNLIALTIECVADAAHSAPAEVEIRQKAQVLLQEFDQLTSLELRQAVETYVQGYSGYSWSVDRAQGGYYVYKPRSRADLYRQISIFAVLRGALNDAAWCALKGVLEAPSDPLVLLQAGVVLDGIDRPLDASAFLTRAYSLRRDVPAIVQAMALNRLSLKDPSDAVGLLLKALSLEPTNTTVMAMLGLAYHRLGMDQSAKVFLRMARHINPGDGNVNAIIEAYGWSSEMDGAMNCMSSTSPNLTSISPENMLNTINNLLNGSIDLTAYGGITTQAGYQLFNSLLSCTDTALNDTGTDLDALANGLGDLNEWFALEMGALGTQVFNQCMSQCACDIDEVCKVCVAKCYLQYCANLNGIYEGYIPRWEGLLDPYLKDYYSKLESFYSCAMEKIGLGASGVAQGELAWIVSNAVDVPGCQMVSNFLGSLQLALNNMDTIEAKVDEICQEARSQYAQAEEALNKYQQELMEELARELEEALANYAYDGLEFTKPAGFEIALDNLFTIGADEAGNIKFGVGAVFVGAKFTINVKNIGFTSEVGFMLNDPTGGNFMSNAISVRGHIDADGSSLSVVASSSQAFGTQGQEFTVVSINRDFSTGKLTWHSDIE